MNITDKAFIELRKIFPQIPDKNVVGLSINLSYNESPIIIVQQHILDVKEIKEVNHVYFIDSTVEKDEREVRQDDELVPCERCEELAYDKATYFRLYEQACIELQKIKKQ